MCAFIVEEKDSAWTNVVKKLRKKCLYLFSGYLENQVTEMNFSAGESNFTVVLMQRDTFETALTKNIIVVALCLSINYINSMLVHTFTKHQVQTDT